MNEFVKVLRKLLFFVWGFGFLVLRGGVRDFCV